MTDLATLRQHQLLTQLLSLARAQGVALVEDRLDDFLALMDERERVVHDLIELEQSPPPANVLPFPTLAPTLGDPDARAAMRGLIRSILGQDDANERTLRAQMEGLHAELAQLNRGAVAGRGYAAALTHDRLGEGLDRAG